MSELRTKVIEAMAETMVPPFRGAESRPKDFYRNASTALDAMLDTLTEYVDEWKQDALASGWFGGHETERLLAVLRPDPGFTATRPADPPPRPPGRMQG